MWKPDMPPTGTLVRCICSSHDKTMHCSVEPGQIAVLVSSGDEMRYRLLFIPQGVTSKPWANFWDFWEPLERELTDEEKLFVVKALTAPCGG